MNNEPEDLNLKRAVWVHSKRVNSIHTLRHCCCPPAGVSKEQEKEKSLEEERSAPQSAFLGPTLWDKTLPYDGDSFQLEYMDLEEFLSENGIPSSPAHHHPHQSQAPIRQPPIMSQAPPTSIPSVMVLSNHASTSVHTSVISATAGTERHMFCSRYFTVYNLQYKFFLYIFCSIFSAVYILLYIFSIK